MSFKSFRFRPARLADLLPLVLAAYIIYLIIATWMGRLFHSYDLEWMEGGMLVHAWRLQHWQPLYVEPDPSFIPMIYPPGYSAVVAAFGSIVGVDYWVGRLVSIVGTLAATGAVVIIIGRHGRDWLMGLFAGAVFLGCYESSGAFYDLVRPDGLYMGFLGFSVVLAMEKRRGTAAAAGLFLAVAFLMKHNAAVFGVPIVVGLYARGGWRQALEFAVASIVPAVLFVGFMQLTSGGMFLEYLVGVPRSHPFKGDRGFAGVPRESSMILPVAMTFVAFWLITQGPKLASKAPIGALVALPVASGVLAGWAGVQLSQVKGMAVASTIQSFVAFGTLGAVGMACLLVMGTALVSAMTWRRWLALSVVVGALTPAIALVAVDWRWLPLSIAVVAGALFLTWLSAYLHWKWVFGVGVALMALFMSCVMRAHHGGFLNVNIHLHWAIAVVFGLGLAEIRHSHSRWWAFAVTALIMSGQLFFQGSKLVEKQNSWFSIERLSPTEDDRDAGDRFVEALKEYEGPVLSAFAPWLAVQAGFEPSFHLIALWDIAQHKEGPLWEESRRIPAAARDHYWGAVVDGTNPMKYAVSGKGAAYVENTVIQPRGKAFTPKTGWRTRPKNILVPRKGPPPR